MFPQLECAISPDVLSKDKVTYFTCMSILHGANFDEKQIKLVREKIIEMIENVETRFVGLLLFEAALKQKTPFYIAKWPEIVLANLDSNSVCKEMAYRILKLIMVPSTNKAHIATAEFYIPKIVNLLIKLYKAHNVSAIQAVTSCLNFSPGSAAQIQETFEPFIIKQMDSNSPQYIEAVSDCFISYLNGLSTVSCNKTTHSYHFYYKKILYSLQHIINKLFCTNDVLYMDNDQEGEVFIYPEKSDDGLSPMMVIARVYETLSHTAAKMICQESDDNRPFEVDILWILEFINKILHNTKQCLNSSSFEYDLLKAIFPMIHRGTFHILESLLQNFGLIHQVENILLLIRRSTELSYSFTYSEGSNFQIRSVTWENLHIWFDKYGIQVSLNSEFNKYLIDELIKDIVPDPVKQKSPVLSQKQHNLKSKSAQPGEFPSKLGDYDKLRARSCSQALKVLSEIVTFNSSFLDNNFIEKIGKSILTTLNTTNNRFLRQKKFPFPYTEAKCRKNMSKLICGVVMSSRFSSSVQMQCLSHLKIWRRDRNKKVRSCIKYALYFFQHGLHPKKKFPEVQINNKGLFETEHTVDETGHIWDSVNTVNVNHSDPANQSAVISDSHTDHSSEAHNSVGENINPSNYVVEKEYSVSDYERKYNVKEGINCNGQDMVEVAGSGASGSGSEEDGNSTADDENISEPPCNPLIASVRSANENEIVLDVDEDSEDMYGEEDEEDEEEEEEEENELVQDEEEENEIVQDEEEENELVQDEEEENELVQDEEEENELVQEEEEENELVQGEEIENMSSRLDKAVIRRDQNGVADVSEEEIVPFSKGKNGECSSAEEDSNDEDCIKEFREEQMKEENEEGDEIIVAAPHSKKHHLSDEIETPPPSKKPRFDEELEEIIDASPPSRKPCLSEEMVNASPPSRKPCLSEEMIDAQPPSRKPYLSEEMIDASPPSRKPCLSEEMINASPPSRKPCSSEEISASPSSRRKPCLSVEIEEIIDTEPPSKQPSLKQEEWEEPIQEETITNSKTEEFSELISVEKVKEDEEEVI